MAQPVNMADIMALSIPERIILVEEIWDSIAAEQEATPLTPEQMAEIDQRIDEWEASPKVGASWEEVKARIQGADESAPRNQSTRDTPT